MITEICNRTKKNIRPAFVRSIVEETVRVSGLKVTALSLSIVFAEKAALRKLNREYRKKDRPTDILSFDYSAGYNGKRMVLDGELVLCPSVIAEQAKENKVSFNRELAFVLSHGILHLMHWKHSKKMYAAQDQVVENIIKKTKK